MRWVVRGVLVVLAVLLILVAIERVAGETGEVVVLRTFDDAGAVQETRVWVVEHDGRPWVRAGNAALGWFQRLHARPDIELVRDGQSFAVRAVSVPEARHAINERMNEKYGWRDDYICFFFSRDQKIPVRLDPR